MDTTNRIKVLNKAKIEELMNNGALMSSNTITAKVYIVSSEDAIYGAVRFDTFLKMRSRNGYRRIHSTYSHDYYAK